jgi:beta-mannanase
MCNDMENMDERQVEVIRYGQYGRKASWILKKKYGKHGRNPSWIVKRFGNYRRKLCNAMENMEEK